MNEASSLEFISMQKMNFDVNKQNPKKEHINERVHWSVMQKRGRPCTVFGIPGTPYTPENLPATIRPDQIAEVTPEEQALLTRP